MVIVMWKRCVLLTMGFSSAIWCGESGTCRPTPEIREELTTATAVPITGTFAAFKNVAPFKALRERFPDNLFVHEAYQDAMHEHGIEGHLRYLTKEYDDLKQQHAGDPMFAYLAWRTLVGRSTPAAVEGLNQVLARHPDFAPAHRTLAEIYGTERFRDPEKEKIERAKFLGLCPGGAFTRRPPGIPEPSLLIEAAERMLGQAADPRRVAAMAMQGQTEYEWRSQRIRAFDWYTLDYKKQDARELRAKNWQAWTIRVRCYWKAGQPQEAASVLMQMKRTLPALRNESEPAYWNGLDVLVRLYAEGGQKAPAAAVLNEMRQVAARNPSRDRAARIAVLGRLVGVEGAGPPE
jgi:hypothetical protein